MKVNNNYLKNLIFQLKRKHFLITFFQIEAETLFLLNITPREFCQSNNHAKLGICSPTNIEDKPFGFTLKIISQKSTKITKVLLVCLQG